MITLIIGQNAIGKSAYLKKRVKQESQKKSDILFNMFDTSYLEKVKYEEERIERLKELLDTEDIITNSGILSIQTEELKISKNFLEMVTLICREGSELFLDEPEYGLGYKEIGFLVAFIGRISDTFENIEIVTHSELFLGLMNVEIKTVTVKNEDEFQITDITGTKYETID